MAVTLKIQSRSEANAKREILGSQAICINIMIWHVTKRMT